MLENGENPGILAIMGVFVKYYYDDTTEEWYEMDDKRGPRK